MTLAVQTYELVKLLPQEEKYGLKSQIRRAAVSIPSNIAEGCSRSSQKEFKYFLEISLVSAFEVETDLILAEKLNMISDHRLLEFLLRLNAIQRRINSLISKIKSSRPG